MKTLFFGSMAMLLSGNLLAQPPHPDGPPKPPSIAERWKHDSTKLQLYVVLNPSQMVAVKLVFVSFYNEMDALMPMPQNTPPAPPAREAIEKVRSKRYAALKAIFNTQQADRFEVFEKEFMPPPMPPHPLKSKDNNEKV